GVYGTRGFRINVFGGLSAGCASFSAFPVLEEHFDVFNRADKCPLRRCRIVSTQRESSKTACVLNMSECRLGDYLASGKQPARRGIALFFNLSDHSSAIFSNFDDPTFWTLRA